MLFRTFLTSLFCLLITGCGFHLRGDTGLAKTLPSLSMHEPMQIAPFQRLLRHTLQLNQVDLVDKASNVPHLIIEQEQFDEESLAVTGNGQLYRSRLTLTIRYQLITPEQEKPYSNSLSLYREFDVNPAAILGSDNERDIHKEELLQDAAAQVMRQLSSLSSEALT